MNKIVALIQSDLRQIFRDKTLAFFLMAPVFLLTFVRFFVPYLTEKYPLVHSYHALIMMFAGIQTAVMFGFVVSFMILEEKDENVLQVIRVLPISPFYFMVYRLVFATVFSAFGALLVICFSGLAYPGFINALLLAVQYGLIAPFITLLVATFAMNKVEGMAYFKGVDLLLLLPLVTFFLDGSIKYIFALIPTYWTYYLYHAVLIGEGGVVSLFCMGLGVYAVLIYVLFGQFKKRVFDR